MHAYLNKLIQGSVDWADLKAKMVGLSTKEKGSLFELFVKYFLQSHPLYTTQLKKIWLFEELSPGLKQELRIPSNDQGIDLVAQSVNGQYWAIQCKFLEDEARSITHRAISTFGNLTFAISGKFNFGLVCTTAERSSRIYRSQESISFCTSEVWSNLTPEQFGNIRKLAVRRQPVVKPKTPLPHQQVAIRKAVGHFVKKKAARGKLIFPCGSGKSLTGFWIAKALKARSIVVAVPSLALVRQTLDTWLHESIANQMKVDWICVCSDESIGKRDDVSVFVQDLGIQSVTDEHLISNWLQNRSSKIKVVFTTYQSASVLCAASSKSSFEFEFGILDEAHKTVGPRNKLFSSLLYDENLSIRRRVFMTATERRFLGSGEMISSMDDPKIYGETFDSLSFRHALEVVPPILCDYRLITIRVFENELKDLLDQNALVRPAKGEWSKDMEVQTLTSMVALRKAMNKYPIRHAVSFHSSIARAKAFSDSQQLISEAMPEYGKLDSYHVTGSHSTAERNKTLGSFLRSEKALITNARCLTEGVDVPDIDCILFADPKNSVVDVVQALGRALRRSPGKRMSYVVLPVLLENRNGHLEVNQKRFESILAILRSLASNDDRIIDYFRVMENGGRLGPQLSILSDPNEVIVHEISLASLSKEINLRVWKSLARLDWRPFEEAREFVRELNLKSWKEWAGYCVSGKKPFDIPAAPYSVYRGKGWKGNADWLGTNRIPYKDRKYLPFIEARKFVRKLGLSGQMEWRKYLKSGKKPLNIPSKPERYYLNKGWNGFGDWVGNANVSSIVLSKNYLPFEEARKFARSLNLESRSDWEALFQTSRKPKNIPQTADRHYRKTGWISWPDFLGTRRQFEFIPFDQAKRVVWKFNIKGQAGWRKFIKSPKFPAGIPKTPYHYYKDLWKSWSDWTGYKSRGPETGKYIISYEQMKVEVQKLGFKGTMDWFRFTKSKKFPSHYPKYPDVKFKYHGWKSWPDFLGSGLQFSKKRVFLTYEEAKRIIHPFKIQSQKEWFQWRKSPARPKNIPTDPFRFYYENGWKGWPDFLGYDRKKASRKY